MNRFSLLLFLLVAVLLTAETKPQNSYPVKRGFRPVIALDKVPESAFESGRVLIKFKAEAAGRIEAAPVMEKSEGNLFFGIDEVDKLNKQFRIKRATQHFYSPALKNTFSERHKAWGFHLWYELEFDATTTDVKTIVNSYSKINELEIVEPVYKKQLISAGNPVIAEEVEDKNTDNKSTTWTPNDPRFAEQWHYHNTGQQSGTADKDI
ncbi:MAG TPA: subtilase family N-terminal domain-containing protein, partial [Bacteroidales bacterium]|nr:subtilase family N-terminal domain-containing protein [Bacteroidales bacterium]